MVDNFINVFSVLSLAQCFDADIATIIFATNAIETREFLSTQVNGRHLLICAILLLVTVVLLLIEARIKVTLNNRMSLCLFVGILIASGLSAYNPVGEIPLSGFLKSVSKSLSSPSGVSSHLNDTTIEYFHGKDKPQKIVVILGESLTPDHLSLYGYPQRTTPQLDSIARNEGLFVFKNVKSPGLSTAISMKYIFTDLMKTEENSLWTDRLNVIELLNNTHYSTLWISNQSQAGNHNNIGRLLANLCDEDNFVYTVDGGYSSTDDVLLPAARKMHDKFVADTTFTLIHLMGSHPDFSLRYPAKFHKWSGRDYPRLAASQQNVVADYDNTVLFNDLIVTQIISFYHDDDAIIIYFPDHGVDLFVSAPDYAAHGRPGNKVSVEAASKIPLIIYTTDAFKNKHHKLEKALSDAESNKEWCTDKFIYLIADIIGVKSINGKNVAQYSLLHD